MRGVWLCGERAFRMHRLWKFVLQLMPESEHSQALYLPRFHQKARLPQLQLNQIPQKTQQNSDKDDQGARRDL